MVEREIILDRINVFLKILDIINKEINPVMCIKSNNEDAYNRIYKEIIDLIEKETMILTDLK